MNTNYGRPIPSHALSSRLNQFPGDVWPSQTIANEFPRTLQNTPRAERFAPSGHYDKTIPHNPFPALDDVREQLTSFPLQRNERVPSGIYNRQIVSENATHPAVNRIPAFPPTRPLPANPPLGAIGSKWPQQANDRPQMLPEDDRPQMLPEDDRPQMLPDQPRDQPQGRFPPWGNHFRPPARHLSPPPSLDLFPPSAQPVSNLGVMPGNTAAAPNLIAPPPPTAIPKSLSFFPMPERDKTQNNKKNNLILAAVVLILVGVAAGVVLILLYVV